ncbi:39S ribosomal protein L44, mitochondrial-like [Mercenaria mercenaria]|uniref:39S ribosomal protein L44, mitochondrial-like n=1 Tax=Mercenaria mercenaria TaxID=6596 RepID=UPI00234EB4C5|nr:39S ribosomal protein L44, mitochondrial-like [Mercenaria mercenaria]
MATICGSFARAKNAFTLKSGRCVTVLIDQNNVLKQANRHNTNTSHQYALRYTNSRRKVAYMQELYHRRLEVGPEKERHPSVYGCWSHDSEIYAFSQRLGEKFDEKLLKQAFVQSSYVEQEIEKQKDLGLDVEVDIEDNFELAQKGHLLASRFIKAYLRYSFPQLFEEGICAIHDYLMSDETLLHVGSNLGLRELMQTAEYPPEDHNYITTLLAVIGALLESQGEHAAEMFVLDFIVPQLVGRDINELWNLNNPMGLLAAMLKEAGRGEPEPRLLWSACRNTLMPLHHVGIYSDKKLIGKSPGETMVIAEELAAREALKSLMKTEDSRAPLVFGDKSRNLKLDYNTKNRSVSEFVGS